MELKIRDKDFFTKGNIYYLDYNNGLYTYIFKFKNINGINEIHSSCYIYNEQAKSNYVKTSAYIARTNDVMFKIRKATPDEARWLRECIKAEKFIPFEKIPKN